MLSKQKTTIIGGSKNMRYGLRTWDPFREIMNSWNDDSVAGDFVPAANVYQDKDNVIVQMDVPGMKADDIDITVENDVLTVSGQRKDEKEVKKEDYYRKEASYGSFSRSMILPMSVKGNEAQADFKDGVLKITLPKAEEVKPKKIAVKVN